jgi:hypothetical protein
MAAKHFLTERIHLDAAKNRLPFHWAGWYFRVIGSSSPSAQITVRVDEADSQAREMRQGAGWTQGPFTRLYLSWDAQPGEWVDVLVGGDPDDYQPGEYEAFPSADREFIEAVNDPKNPLPVVGGRQPLSDFAKDALVGSWSVKHTGNTNTVTAYTVPAGKVFRLRDSYLKISGADVGTASIVDDQGRRISHASVYNSEIRAFRNVELPEGYEIRLTTFDAALTVSFSRWGEEQDA